MTQSDFVNSNGIRQHYWRTGGDKPQVLLLHGLTDTGACWNPVIEALKADYDCIAPDARGHGLSDAPAQGYSPEDHAADAAGLIQALGLKRPVVVGHSMGGMQSTVLAARHPELLRGVVLEDPAWFTGETKSSEARRTQLQEWAERMRREKVMTKTALIEMGHKDNPRWSNSELDAWADAKHQVRPNVLSYIDAEAGDWCSMLKTITCPVMLVTGAVSRGVIITPEIARAAQAINNKVEVANIPDTGHCIRRDDFVGFITALQDFLRRNTN